MPTEEFDEKRQVKPGDMEPDAIVCGSAPERGTVTEVGGGFHPGTGNVFVWKDGVLQPDTPGK